MFKKYVVLAAAFTTAMANSVEAQEYAFVDKAEEECSREDVGKGMLIGAGIGAVAGTSLAVRYSARTTLVYAGRTQTGQRVTTYSKEVFDEAAQRGGVLLEKKLPGTVNSVDDLWTAYAKKPALGYRDALLSSEALMKVTAPLILGSSVVYGAIGTVGGAYVGCASDAIEKETASLYKDSWAERTVTGARETAGAAWNNTSAYVKSLF